MINPQDKNNLERRIGNSGYWNRETTISNMVVREDIFEKFHFSKNKGNKKASHADIQGNINVLGNYQKKTY